MTSHDKSPRTPKSPSPSEELDSRIFRGYCGVKEFNNPGPPHTKLKAHVEEEEMTEDEKRRPKWPKNITKDNHVLGQSRS